MADPAGEADSGALRLDFDRRVMLRFCGLVITSDGGLLAYRELDDVLALTMSGGERLAEARAGKNRRHLLVGLLRQSAAAHRWVGLPRPARWDASRPNGWPGRRTLPRLPICLGIGSTPCTGG